MKHPRYSVFAAAALVIGLACNDCGAQTVLISPQVFRGSALLYREFHTEFLGCLYGLQRNDTIGIYLMAPASMRPSTSQALRIADDTTGSCPKLAEFQTLGLVHSHPDCKHVASKPCLAVQALTPRVDPDSELNACIGSSDDMTTWKDNWEHLHWPLGMIVCGYGKLIVYVMSTSTVTPVCVYDPEESQPDCRREP